MLKTTVNAWYGVISDSCIKGKFVGSHDIFMPRDVVESCVDNLRLKKSSTVMVLFNIEFIISLVYTYNINPKNITFYSDNAIKTRIAKKLGITNVVTELNNDMKQHDYVLLNPPFGKFKEFKVLAQKLAKEKALIISGSRDYQTKSSFDNVEYYQYLGPCFPSAQILASLAIVNPRGTTTTTVIDNTGTFHTVNTEDIQPPGDDVNAWLFANKVAALKLKGFEANMGSIYYEKTVDIPNGTPCIFTVGKTNEPLASGRIKNIGANDLVGTKGIGKHKLVISKTGTAGKLGAMKYAGPEYAVGFGTYFIEFSSESEVHAAIAYCESDPVKKLVKGIKPNTVVNGQSMWKKIPHITEAKKWIQLK